MSAAGPWAGVSGVRQVWLVLTVVALTLRHWVRRPYRLGRPPRPVRGPGARLRAGAGSAVYDSVISRFLRGYTELTRTTLHAQTGALVILLYRLMAAFDSEFERRVRRGDDMRFAAILASAPVQPHLTALSTFLAPYPQRHAIRAFLESFTADNYERYLALHRGNGPRGPVYLEMIELDSGGFLGCTAHVVAIFNGHETSERVLREFVHLGVVGKLADDLVDIWADRRSGVANLLNGMVEDSPGGGDVLARHAERRRRAGYRWWRDTCPTAFERFTEVLAAHRDCVTAPSLRLAADMMLLPAAWGGPATRPADPDPTPVAPHAPAVAG